MANGDKSAPKEVTFDAPISGGAAPQTVTFDTPAPTGNAGTQEHPLVTPLPGEDFAFTMRRGVEMGKRVTPEQIKTATEGATRDAPLVLAAASAPGLVTGLAEGATSGLPGLLKFGRGALGALAGAGVGERVGAGAGSLFGETGKAVGGTLGTIAGGVAGGGMAAGLDRLPATPKQAFMGEAGPIRPLPFGIQRFIPEAFVSKGELGSVTHPGPFDTIPLEAPESARFGYIPKGPSQPLSESPNAPATKAARDFAAGKPGPFNLRSQSPNLPTAREMATGPLGDISESVAGTRPRAMILTPEEARTEEFMGGVASKRASERGMQFAGGMTPREGRTVPRLPTSRPTSEFSGVRERIPLTTDAQMHEAERILDDPLATGTQKQAARQFLEIRQ